jgi:hypothetical protein
LAIGAAIVLDEVVLDAVLLDVVVVELLVELGAFGVVVVTGSVNVGCDDSLLACAELGTAAVPWDPAVAGPVGAGAAGVADADADADEVEAAELEDAERDDPAVGADSCWEICDLVTATGLGTGYILLIEPSSV